MLTSLRIDLTVDIKSVTTKESIIHQVLGTIQPIQQNFILFINPLLKLDPLLSIK